MYSCVRVVAHHMIRRFCLLFSTPLFKQRTRRSILHPPLIRIVNAQARSLVRQRLQRLSQDRDQALSGIFELDLEARTFALCLAMAEIRGLVRSKMRGDVAYDDGCALI
jgi:hypothetical protein